jgi:hypothetical protein
MTNFSLLLLAKILVALLMLVILRCLAEVFIIEYTNPRAVPYDQLRPFLIGAAASALSLSVTLISVQFGWSRLAILVSTVTLAGLFFYTVYFSTF